MSNILMSTKMEKETQSKKPHTAGCWSGKGTESALLRYLFPGFSVDAKHGWTDTVVIVSVLKLVHKYNINRVSLSQD